jgi:hypothetical protein
MRRAFFVTILPSEAVAVTVTLFSPKRSGGFSAFHVLAGTSVWLANSNPEFNYLISSFEILPVVVPVK